MQIRRRNPTVGESPARCATGPQEATRLLSKRRNARGDAEVRCQDVWEGCEAIIIVRDAMGFADAETWAGRVEMWEADPATTGHRGSSTGPSTPPAGAASSRPVFGLPLFAPTSWIAFSTPRAVGVRILHDALPKPVGLRGRLTVH